MKTPLVILHAQGDRGDQGDHGDHCDQGDHGDPAQGDRGDQQAEGSDGYDCLGGVLLLLIRMNFNFHRICLLMKDVFPTAASPAKTTLEKYKPLR